MGETWRLHQLCPCRSYCSYCSQPCFHAASQMPQIILDTNIHVFWDCWMRVSPCSLKRSAVSWDAWTWTKIYLNHRKIARHAFSNWTIVFRLPRAFLEYPPAQRTAAGLRKSLASIAIYFYETLNRTLLLRQKASALIFDILKLSITDFYATSTSGVRNPLVQYENTMMSCPVSQYIKALPDLYNSNYDCHMHAVACIRPEC